MYVKPSGRNVRHILHLGLIASAAMTAGAALSSRPPRPTPVPPTGEALAARAEELPVRKPEEPLAAETGLASFYGAAGSEELFAAHPSYARHARARDESEERARGRGPD
jgi:hypothetical protein